MSKKITTEKRIKTSREAKGPQHLRLLEKTAASVYQSRVAPRTAANLKHCHALKSIREVRRIDRREWEARISQILRLCEEHRLSRANSLYSALDRVHSLLRSAHIREDKLKTTTGELQRTSTYLQTLLDSMMDILLATDTLGAITEVNRATERLSGLDRRELIGRHFSFLFSDPQMARAGIEQVLAERELFNYELALIRKDGRRVPIILNATVLLDAQGLSAGVLVSARDMTDLKQAQESLQLYAQELARANTDLEEFASIASHDLQEPLKKLIRFAGALEKRYRDEFDVQAKRDLANMVDLASAMREMIGSVLDYARVETAERTFERTDCEALFDQALAILQASLVEATVEVRRDPLPVVSAEAAQLLRVFQNVVGNALKYHDPDKEHPYVHVSAHRIEGSGIRIPDAEFTTGWLLKVEDNGIGIHPDFVEEVFDMFVKLVPGTPGAGMGLAITRKIIRRHKGSIWVESELGRGSTFYFTIPD